MTLLSCVPMTLLLMGVERLLSCFCRRYLVANSWIEVGARDAENSAYSASLEVRIGWRRFDVWGKCSWAVSSWAGLNWAAGEPE
jgi:hypothetical protein